MFVPIVLNSNGTMSPTQLYKSSQTNILSPIYQAAAAAHDHCRGVQWYNILLFPPTGSFWACWSQQQSSDWREGWKKAWSGSQMARERERREKRREKRIGCRKGVKLKSCGSHFTSRKQGRLRDERAKEQDSPALITGFTWLPAGEWSSYPSHFHTPFVCFEKWPPIYLSPLRNPQFQSLSFFFLQPYGPRCFLLHRNRAVDPHSAPLWRSLLEWILNIWYVRHQLFSYSTKQTEATAHVWSG